MGIIGGADGPTVVVVSHSFVLCAVAVLAAILAAGVILFTVVKQKK